jgi:SAM-dependent methyltransferase
MDLLQPRSVLDVGCGQGEWLEAFPVTDVWGVDIAAPDREGLLQRDLTEPLELGRTFDLVLCLEVGEHLPEEAADTLVVSLMSHGDNIVFGAAVPGQEGVGHINCQPHEYWHRKFAAVGYTMHDIIRPLIDHPHVSPWYRNNMFLYRDAAA